MSIPAIIIASLCYVTAAVSCYKQEDYGHCWMWIGYVVANMGILIYEINKKG